MAAKIIILEQPELDPPKYNVVYWADVPADRQKHWADAEKTSYYSEIDPVDLARIKAGQIAEQWNSVSFPPGTSQAVVDANLVAGWTQWQDEVNAKNPWASYGRKWDGTNWEG